MVTLSVFIAVLGVLGSAWARSLIVNTTAGQVYGMINGSTPDVVQFLGIPFAAPPVGDLRFAPPRPKQRESNIIDATKTSPNCPQYPLTTVTAPSIYTFDSPWLQPYGPWSEDCLTLNIWLPRTANAKEKLPVLIWMFGGGFYEGGLLTNGMNPSTWIQRTQSHIVVALKYVVLYLFPVNILLIGSVTATISSAFPMPPG